MTSETVEGAEKYFLEIQVGVGYKMLNNGYGHRHLRDRASRRPRDLGTNHKSQARQIVHQVAI